MTITMSELLGKCLFSFALVHYMKFAQWFIEITNFPLICITLSNFINFLITIIKRFCGATWPFWLMSWIWLPLVLRWTPTHTLLIILYHTVCLSALSSNCLLTATIISKLYIIHICFCNQWCFLMKTSYSQTRPIDSLCKAITAT